MTPDAVRESGDDPPKMDERGLVELDDSVAKRRRSRAARPTIEAREMTTRKINAELRWLVYEEGIGTSRS